MQVVLKGKINVVDETYFTGQKTLIKGTCDQENPESYHMGVPLAHLLPLDKLEELGELNIRFVSSPQHVAIAEKIFDHNRMLRK